MKRGKGAALIQVKVHHIARSLFTGSDNVRAGVVLTKFSDLPGKRLSGKQDLRAGQSP
jgi:hypothetical protein